MFKKLLPFVLFVFLFSLTSSFTVMSQSDETDCATTIGEITFVNDGFPEWAISTETAYELYLDLGEDLVQSAWPIDAAFVSDAVIFFDYSGPMDNPAQVQPYSFDPETCAFAESDSSDSVVIFVSIRDNLDREVVISHLVMAFVYARGGEDADAAYFGAQAFTAVHDLDAEGCPSFVSETESKSPCLTFVQTLSDGN